ncbi:melanocyte-stimulating hormone receptor-like [Exaiptasia diaphana]|uniref:G-protein coupled receptors family 1 profile domain-containing protein n=1 Tax=Exaiptasia diaphana TaxID=2652724 RepID=A0A913YSJ8_EXADI|nr:melanocyte-stimulating hormone receptor-like [Exaiptasia diaphana]
MNASNLSNAVFSEEKLRNDTCFFLPQAAFDKIHQRYNSNLVTAIINMVFAPVAVTANSILACVVFRNASLRKPSTFLLGCLAVCDFLVGLLVQPSYVAFRFFENLKQFVPCSVRMMYSTGFYVCYGVSFMTLSAISCERYVALTLHLRYKELVTTRRVLALVVLIWAIDLLLTGLQWAGINKIVRGILLALWCSCILISIIVHCGIIRIVRRHQKLIKEQQQASSTRYRRQTKLAMNIAYIVAIYFLFNIPVLCVTIYHQIGSGALESYAFYNWSETIALCNSSINPFVCCWKSRDIRKTLIKTFRKGLCNVELRAEEESATSGAGNKSKDPATGNRDDRKYVTQYCHAT